MSWIHLRHLPVPGCLHLRSVPLSLRSSPDATAQHPAAGQAKAPESRSRPTRAAEARPWPCTKAILTRPSGRSLFARQPVGSGDLPPARRLGQPAAALLRLDPARYLRGPAAREAQAGRRCGLTCADPVCDCRAPRLPRVRRRWRRGLGTLRWQGRDSRGPLCACASARPGPQRHRLQGGQLPAVGFAGRGRCGRTDV